jgi:magnesium transporter
MGQRTEGAFVADAVTFILAKDKLVTVRTVKPRSFAIGRSRASARIENADGAPSVLMALLEGIVERIADILQETSRDATKLSAEIFVAEGARIQLPRALRTIGRSGTLISICHDSLSSLKRLIEFTAQICTHYALPEARLRALSRDVAELERRAETLQSHIAILLDAALGLVGAQQNNSVKALSLATVAFVPPTLIASIFGMNFQAMDWFKAPWGPWVAFGLMVVTPIALFAIAKARSWF